MNDIDKIKDRIRKLLDLGADAAAASGEIENALRFARALMTQHQISEDEVRAAEKDPHVLAAMAERTAYDAQNADTQGSRVSIWELYLAQAVGTLIGTVSSYQIRDYKRNASRMVVFDEKGAPKFITRLVFYGPEEDVRDAVALQAEWASTISALARLKYGSALRGSGNSYAIGFSAALNAKADQIIQQERQAIGSGGKSSNVPMIAQVHALAQEKKKSAKAWLEREHGVKLRSGGSRSVSMSDKSAFCQGQADGRKSEFSHQRTRKIGK